MKTQALVLKKFGTPNEAFENTEISLPALKSTEVLIENEAFGLNYADVMARQGLYRETPPLPCVIGYEVVGKIIEIGSKVDSTFLGKRIAAITHFGGYSKHSIAPTDSIVCCEDLPAPIALALTTQAITAFYMADYVAPIQKGDKVLIHAAAGGVGTMLIQLAKNKGATVFAKVSSDEKAQKCLSLGADYAINYKTSDYTQQIQAILGEQKIDVSYNPIGGSTFKSDKKLLANGSRLFLFGGSQLAEGGKGILSQMNFLRKMGIIVPAFMMMQSKSVIGVNMLKIATARPDILKHCLQAVMDLYKAGTLHPEIGGEYTANELNTAHDHLQSGKSIGKIAVSWQ